jgi:hypothetical protein
MTGLTVDAVAVAVEDDPRYVAAGQMPTDPVQLRAVMRQWPHGVPTELGAEYLASVSDHAGIPMPALRMLTVREDGTEAAALALAGLGAPPQPQPLVLVQAAADRDSSAMLLPRLVHELAWHVTEEMGLTHLGDLGGTAILELLSWWADERVGATVLIVDQPLFVGADRAPDRISAVALRFGGGDGPLRVLDWGEDAPPDGADRQFTGDGACGGWPDLHAALGRHELRTGDRIVVRSGTGDRQGWGLLRYQAAATDRRPAWWRSRVRVGSTR